MEQFLSTHEVKNRLINDIQKFFNIVNRLSEERRKSINEFVALLQKKVQIEFLYAKSLDELSEMKMTSFDTT